MEKRIITYEVDSDDNIHVFTHGFIFGNYDNSFPAYVNLVHEAIKDFPYLKLEDIELSVVTKSKYMKGFILIRFPLRANTTHPNYANWTRFDFDDH